MPAIRGRVDARSFAWKGLHYRTLTGTSRFSVAVDLIEPALMTTFRPPYPVIKDALNRAGVIPFLGSGASLGLRSTPWDRGLAAHLPTAGELARYLAARAGYPTDEPTQLAIVAQYFRVSVGTEALNEELHGIFGGSYQLPRVHRYLARLPRPLLIVTTNYDDLIELAFRESGRSLDVVIHTTDARLADRLLWWPDGASEPIEVSAKRLDIDISTTSVVYKMHGAIDRDEPGRDQYVITEDDYVDFLTRMTKGKAIPAVFAEPFQERHFLFLGYGLRDWNLRVVLARIEKDLRRPKGRKSWAIDAKPSPLETRFWQDRGVESYALAIDEFVDGLEFD